jgi:transcriptional regulator with GAF, ATPase, and Fis domain
MPSLRVQPLAVPAGARASTQATTPTLYHLHKRLTTLGASADNDIVLPDPLLAESQAYIECDGQDHHLVVIEGATEVFVNGKRRRRHKLADRDQIRMGNTELSFCLRDEAPGHPQGPGPRQDPGAGPGAAPAPRRQGDDVDSLRRLYEFSARLLCTYEINTLLDQLMDAVIEITSASKGFLVLLEGEQQHIKVARNLRRETLGDPGGQLSDSIVDKVIKTRRPLILSDALSDEEFQNAKSVMNLRLSSVMCVPLLERGNLLGLIYVGNDSVRSLFVEEDLQVLTVLAAQASLLIRNALLVNELRLESRLLNEQIEQMRYGSIIGTCAAMQEVFKKVGKVAGTDISVLITGETGTGKELIAQEIHRRSPRAKAPLVTINCGAIPEHLLESELFGHIKGAFTGAVQNKQGRFHVANGGTVFLDEIGEMPLQLQVKLLRVLQEKVVVRVGDTRSEPVDIRVLAATNRDLLAEIKAGRFREDLYYRLNVVQIHLPPLRDRGDDVMVIAKYLLRRYEKEFGGKSKGLSPSAVVAIRKYGWPGNIRQLENHLKKAIVLSDHALLSPEDLGLSEDVLPPVLPLQEAKERFQRQYIGEVLALNNGNRTKTARDLGVDPRTIFRYLEKEDGGPGPSPGPGDDSGEVL